MRTNRHIEALKSKRNKHAIFSIVVVVMMLIAFYQLPQFQEFDFMNIFPACFIFIVCLSFFKKAKDEPTEKNSLLLNILYITTPFLFVNAIALSSLFKFTDYSAVRIANYASNPPLAVGQIHLHSYTVGSGRSKSHYDDVVLNDPSQTHTLRLVCNFMNHFKSCPQLESFQEQDVSIRYYTNHHQFIYPEVLVLSVSAANQTISRQDFMQIYQQQKNNFLIYLFFIVLLSNLLAANLLWRDYQYRHAQTARYRPRRL